MMSSNSERRTSPRLPLKMLVQFRVNDLDEFMRDYAVNISAGGMFIRSDEPLPVGTMVYLQFRVADGESLIEGLGKIVHVNPPDDAAPGMGVEFVNLDESSLALIDKIIQERMTELEE